jgi:hypothetical protein
MPKYATIAIDSGNELARLTFSKDMKKTAKDLEAIRGVNNYPGATERINMLARRFKDYKAKGITVVVVTHEQIEKIYAKGGMITPKGGTPTEPIGVKGWPLFPGSTCPTEVMGACDNVFRARFVNQKLQWICIPEPLGGGGDEWVVRDSFNAPALHVAGMLPPDYQEIEKLAKAHPDATWFPPYIWLIYGAPGTKKTRSLLSFPRPIKIFDIERKTGVLRLKDGSYPTGVDISQYVSEEESEYARFLNDLEAAAQ